MKVRAINDICQDLTRNIFWKKVELADVLQKLLVTPDENPGRANFQIEGPLRPARC
jgi:hypothetical protein